MQISEKWYMNVHELIPSHEDQRIHFGIGSYPFGGPILRYIEGIQYIRGLGFAKIPPAGHPPYA